MIEDPESQILYRNLFQLRVASKSRLDRFLPQSGFRYSRGAGFTRDSCLIERENTRSSRNRRVEARSRNRSGIISRDELLIALIQRFGLRHD